MSAKLEEALRRAAQDPFQFEDMVRQWNDAFQDGTTNPVTAAVERAADQALLDITARDDSALVGGRLRQLIHALPHAAFVVSNTGMITAMNEAAMRRTLLGPGDDINDLDYQLEEAEPIAAMIRRNLTARNSMGEVVLKRAVHGQSDRSATLAMIPSLSNAGDPSALLFLIDPVWRAEVEAMVARAFGLTSAESAVLMAFLDGYSLTEIAQIRDTSAVTVRTQFQRLMEKTGAHSQAELMRNTLAISQFFQDMAPLSDVAGHPHRKTFDVMRPGGRSLDVTLSGDMDGFPVVILSTLCRHTFPAWFEKALADGGILAIHLWRQGQGRSDPLPPHVDLIKGMAEDLLAPLDQLGIARCPVVTYESSLIDAMRMTQLTGDRISRIISFSSFLPISLRGVERVRIPWAAACSRAAQTSPLVLRMIITAGNKAWQAMGSRRFARFQLGASQADLESIDMPGVTQALEEALLGSIAQGVDENCRTMNDAFGEWADELRKCRLPIEMVHGDEDPCTAIEDIRRVTTEVFPDIALTEVPNAGYMLPYHYPQVLIDRVRAAHGEPE